MCLVCFTVYPVRFTMYGPAPRRTPPPLARPREIEFESERQSESEPAMPMETRDMCGTMPRRPLGPLAPRWAARSSQATNIETNKEASNNTLKSQLELYTGIRSTSPNGAQATANALYTARSNGSHNPHALPLVRTDGTNRPQG